VTHDQEEALALSDQIVVMQDGIIAQRGSPEEIYRQPVSSYVADFIGETNLLRGVAPGGQIIAIRPEHVRIEASSSAASPAVAGTVSDVRFMGPVHRVFVTTQDGQEIRADITGQPLETGSPVVVAWSEANAVQLLT
jgi:ABC-type Fe3+/spermidine/putrescine transport system ATPase subunit